jgi:hypothetical protein
MAPSLSVAIVTFRTPRRLLETALRSLAQAVAVARDAGLLGGTTLFVVDNGAPLERSEMTQALAAWPQSAGPQSLVAGHGNVGFGRANNLALARADSDFHLVMNPDVELDPDALRAALAALAAHPDVGMVAPSVTGDDGERQYLCKRYPSVWVLFLRGFAPQALRRRHAAALSRYEMRDVIADRYVPDIPLASGCFMLARTALLKRIGGFDARFFMYFEDYDLSLRLRREARIAYVPQARIVHHGGEAARKGSRHVAWFITSAWRFFRRHGWRSGA